MSDERKLSFWKFDLDDPRLKLSRHKVFNLSRPEKSLLLLAPLSESARGLGLCADGDQPAIVFAGTDDPDYRTLLAMVEAGKAYLEKIKRFDMPGFEPRPEYVNEMKRYGVLAASFDPASEAIDVYDADEEYFRMFWHRPTSGGIVD